MEIGTPYWARARPNLAALRSERQDKGRAEGFAARKSVSKCSILFRFVCGPRTVWNENGRFWSTNGRESTGFGTIWYGPTGAAGRGGEGVPAQVAGSVHGDIVARVFLEIKVGYMDWEDSQDSDRGLRGVGWGCRLGFGLTKPAQAGCGGVTRCTWTREPRSRWSFTTGRRS